MNEDEFASVEVSIRMILSKVMNLRNEKHLSKKNSFNYKKIMLIIEGLENELTSARASERTSLIISKKKIKRRSYATA